MNMERRFLAICPYVRDMSYDEKLTALYEELAELEHQQVDKIIDSKRIYVPGRGNIFKYITVADRVKEIRHGIDKLIKI